MNARIARIQTKLAALPVSEKAVLGPRLTEARLSVFEDSHGVRLPVEFRQFLTRIGHGGYGPTYGLLPMEQWVSRQTGMGRPAEPFPVIPDRDIPQGPADQGEFAGSFPGTIAVVYRGCSDFTLLVVTGPGRGRLVEVNGEGFFAPRFHTDSDFLSWYERWLDFVLTGHRDLTRFADQMSGNETQLVATLLDDELPTRRQAAACTFITHPDPSTDLPGALLQAFSTETHPAVREAILRALAAQGEHGRDLLATALTDSVPGIRFLAVILMTTRAPEGRRLPAQRREVLSRHLANETDDSVRDSIERALDLT
ncbi:SMI1/KNR4 family protein [Streptomyces sp. NPDC059582]|uniref:SMI1/KNR4 family protein n=1 Tax=Streptomyces sp. NPDC059582 TaxID=3346875 RepID=UPI0036BC1389